MVLTAAKTRATDGTEGDYLPGHATGLGPAKVGGFDVLNIPATTGAACLADLKSFDLPADEAVLAALYERWQTDKATRENLNVVSGDFIEETDLVEDVIAMDSRWPIQADSIRVGAPQDNPVNVEQDQSAGAFVSVLEYLEARGPGDTPENNEVSYRISPADGPNGPTMNGSDTAEVTSGILGLARSPDVDAGPRQGTWTLTASTPGASNKATWTLRVIPSSTYTLRAVKDEPATVPVGLAAPGRFAVLAVNASGDPVAGASVTFDARSVGMFAGAASTTATTGPDGIARASAFTAGTRAPNTSISVSSSGAPTLVLPLKVSSGPPATFVVLSGDLQTARIDTKFSSLTGRFLDRYGNVVTDLSEHDRELSVSPPAGALWPNNESRIDAPAAAADGTITAPDLTAGRKVLDGTDPAHALIVRAGSLVAWRLAIAPGPPAAVAATGGGGQQTAKNQPFARPLTAKVTDAGGNPIPGAPVTFKVTSGQASFPGPDAALVGVIPGYRRVETLGRAGLDTITVPAGSGGVATAPVLTAGHRAGKIVVTASADGAPAAVGASFTLSANAVAPTAPSITSLADGDGHVTVSFAGASDGTSPITSYEVRGDDVSHPDKSPVTADGSDSPIDVRGLTNGDTYVFSVTATSVDGTSAPSAPSGRLNVGVPPVVQSGPADGTVDRLYSSSFQINGAPRPTVDQISGNLPPGLTLAADGTLTGTPTQAGSFEFTVEAVNPVGIYDATVTVTISAALLGAPPPNTRPRAVHATVCPTPAKNQKDKTPACTDRTLIGTFPTLDTNARATLVRDKVIYAAGHVNANYSKLILRRRRDILADSYTLVLRHARDAIFVAVEIQ
jgi:hypothetical protein